MIMINLMSSLAVSDSDLIAPSVPDGACLSGAGKPDSGTYSIRCAPHVVGVLRDTMAWVEQHLIHEINLSNNDNPLYDVEIGVVHNSGNFYDGYVAHVAQGLISVVAGVLDLLDHQLALLADEKFNLRFTSDLITRVDPDDLGAGVHHGFRGAQIAALALTAEAFHLYVTDGLVLAVGRGVQPEQDRHRGFLCASCPDDGRTGRRGLGDSSFGVVSGCRSGKHEPTQQDDCRPQKFIKIIFQLIKYAILRFVDLDIFSRTVYYELNSRDCRSVPGSMI